jgi:hypothetical protein
MKKNRIQELLLNKLLNKHIHKKERFTIKKKNIRTRKIV